MKHREAAAPTLGSEDCLFFMAEIHTMFGKCLHVIYMTGEQPGSPVTDTHG